MMLVAHGLVHAAELLLATEDSGFSDIVWLLIVSTHQVHAASVHSIVRPDACQNLIRLLPSCCLAQSTRHH